MERRGIKAGELAAELMKNPEVPVWCGAWNGYVSTYAVVDHIFKFRYEEVSNDFFGTPGRMDKRLFDKNVKEVFYVGSDFGKIPNPEIDFGDDNIDYPIRTINGEEGDPDLVWKLSGFGSEDGKLWKKEGEGWEVIYDTTTQTLDANNFRDSLRFVGKVIGIETLRNVIELCKIKLNIWT
jgi:hypothetical protein